MAEKKPAAKPKTLDVEKAAAYLGITPDELNRSWARGLKPGTLAKRVGGKLVWSQADLKAFQTAEDARSAPVSEGPAPDLREWSKS